MSNDWKDALRARYPWAAKTSFGIGDGWRELVEETFAKLDEAIRALPAQDHGLDVQVQDVKEKYGTLRIYIVPDYEQLEAICLEAENRSETLCDTCGAAGSLRDRGWISVRCDEHAGP